MQMVYSLLDDFFSLFFPQLCAACEENLIKNENIICTSCIYNLPYTDFHLDNQNPAAKQLYGRIPFVAATSFLNFHKGSKVQNLIHHFKYNNKPEIGIKLGEMYGNTLKNFKEYNEADFIIPVPLHHAKLKKRGYNQSDCFAEGLSKTLDITFSKNALQKIAGTETQTQKSRFSRFENMKNVFSVKSVSLLENKHIILVDDVITTGATLEACALELLKIKGVKLSIVTIAYSN